MENYTKPEAKKFVLNYGVLLGIVSVIMGVIMYITNAYLDPHWIYSVIGIVISIVIIVLAIKAFKHENSGFLSLGDAIKIGIGVALIGGIISAIWSFLLMNFIEPDFMSQMADMQREQIMASNPNMTDEQLTTAMEFGSAFSSPWILAAFSIVSSLFMGLIISLIAGLVMKNKNPYEA